MIKSFKILTYPKSSADFDIYGRHVPQVSPMLNIIKEKLTNGSNAHFPIYLQSLQRAYSEPRCVNETDTVII